jgi:hypothetical protein
MKFSTVIVSAFAALASAAPAKRSNNSFDASQFNNFQFSNVNNGYLGSINSLDFAILEQLSQVNNFNLNGFENLFSSNQFDLNSILQLQQLQMVIQLEQLGVLGGFDLSSLSLNNLNFGLIQNNVGGLDLSQFIDSSIAPQIATIVSQTGM